MLKFRSPDVLCGKSSAMASDIGLVNFYTFSLEWQVHLRFWPSTRPFYVWFSPFVTKMVTKYA